MIFPFHQWHSSFASVFPDGSSLYAKRRLLCESLSLIFLAGIPPHVVPDSLMLFVTTALAPIATSDAMEISPIIFAPDAINTLFPITAHLSDPFVAPMVTPSCILKISRFLHDGQPQLVPDVVRKDPPHRHSAGSRNPALLKGGESGIDIPTLGLCSPYLYNIPACASIVAISIFHRQINAL